MYPFGVTELHNPCQRSVVDELVAGHDKRGIETIDSRPFEELLNEYVSAYTKYGIHNVQNYTSMP